jgi:hypothetical protein
MKKLSKKHIEIFETIKRKGWYKPGYSDQEPATKTLLKNGIIEWRVDYRALVFTKDAEAKIKAIKHQSNGG